MYFKHRICGVTSIDFKLIHFTAWNRVTSFSHNTRNQIQTGVDSLFTTHLSAGSALVQFVLRIESNHFTAIHRLLLTHQSQNRFKESTLLLFSFWFDQEVENRKIQPERRRRGTGSELLRSRLLRFSYLCNFISVQSILGDISGYLGDLVLGGGSTVIGWVLDANSC